jgi:molybdopterin/thiamine biosynthesis adenylyltransferase
MFRNIQAQLGDKDFRKIEQATVVLVGAGGIGSNMAQALAGTGFSQLTLIDGDKVSVRNLPLSSVFTAKDVGRYKVKVVRDHLNAKYGTRMNLVAIPEYTDKVPTDLLTKPDLLVLGVDDRWTRLAVTNIRVEAGLPYVNLGFLGWEGEYLHVTKGTACWACLWRPNDSEKVEKLKREGRCPEPEPNVPGAVTPAAVQHLIGFAVGEIAKIVTQRGRLVQYHKFNVETGASDTRFLDSPNAFRPDPTCPICSKEEEFDVSEFGKN